MFVAKYGTASNIKSRTNRASFLNAITSAQQRLNEMHSRVPANGLVMYVGIIILSEKDGKKKRSPSALNRSGPCVLCICC